MSDLLEQTSVELGPANHGPPSPDPQAAVDRLRTLKRPPPLTLRGPASRPRFRGDRRAALLS